ncbi:translation initiation factor IF-2-like [Peromyscus californicus insignis]|uniref:translation initiation factor IF-2-like n=1 Tax=Peromyscus californicus insignis TaxID=564181 RepID=UPI0022A6881F|nr:translation initiation factor IF-2-like [Peromyscus californicus insignis]
MHLRRLGVQAPFPTSPGTPAAHRVPAERQAARSTEPRRQKHLPLHESSQRGPGSGCLPPPGAARCLARLRRPHSPGSAGASGPGRPRCAPGRRAKTRPHGTHRSSSLGGRTAAARPESRSQPRVAAPPVASNGPERCPRCQRGPGPRVTHRLKCSMIFSSRTFSDGV